MRERPPILVVDDDPCIRKMLVEILGLEGYPVATAANGREALDFLERHPGRYLILLGIAMPVLDGFGVLRALDAMPEERAKHTIVLMSASERLWQSRGYQVEARLAKPFTVDQLIAAVEAAWTGEQALAREGSGSASALETECDTGRQVVLGQDLRGRTAESAHGNEVSEGLGREPGATNQYHG